jgi:PilZ domain
LAEVIQVLGGSGLIGRASAPGRGAGKDQRRADRVEPLPGEPVEIQIASNGSLDVVHARDLSLSGVGVFLPHCFEGCDIDREVDLVISLPRQSAFLVKGIVKHRTRMDPFPSFFGVEFTGLRKDDLKNLALYIEAVRRRRRM